MRSAACRLFAIGLRAARLTIVGGLVFGIGLEAAELPGRDEYAFGFPLAAPGDAEFFAVDLPLEVYRSVADPELRDVGVYNAEGQPIPRLVERPAAAAPGSEREIALGLIPLYGGQAEQSEQLRLLLMQEAGRTRLELDTERAAGEQPQQSLAGYLLDARELEHELQALALTWQPLEEGFIGTIRLDTSDDLRHWRHVGTSALADLKFRETRIEQNRLPLPPGISDFLRISWREMPDGWRLSSVHGVYTGESQSVARTWLELDPAPIESESADSAGESLFDAGGYPPVDRVSLLLPEGNVVVRASIYYRPHGQDAWRLAHNGVFYKLSRQGNTLQSEPAPIQRGRAGPLRASHWKVRVESGVTAGPVRLQLGWRPDQLLFLAQGTPPFELVSGRAQDALQQFPQATVLGDRSLFTMLRQSAEAGEAALGARVDIAGEAGLEISETVSWSVILVWAGLIAAVAVVAWLVYSLARENRA
jgi:hypothetical protein